jgi:hypothetical protein
MRCPALFLIFATAFVTCLGYADDKTLPTKESVSFDGVTFVLASTTENPGEQVKEYLPEGQKFESWTKLAAVREYPKLNDPRAVAENLVRALKQQNPQAPSSIIQNPKTGEVIVDFVTWPSDQSFVEFNVFKYSKKEGGGLIAQQYALREYQDTATFLKALKPVRTRIVDLMAKSGLEVKK